MNDWEQRKLGDIVTRVTRKNTNLESTRPLTISAQFGLVDQNTFFNKQIASKDVSGYYLLEKGEFAYNKSYSNGYPWGAIKRLDKYDMGVLSTLYICFKPVDINSDFLASYYDTNRWYKEVSKHAAEGARNHGLLNIAASDFFETELVVPANQNEQEQLANFFKTLDNTITLHQQQLENLKKTKKAYLQKMFPKNNEKVPEIRFEGFADDWEQRKLGEVTDSYSGGTPLANNRAYYGGNIPFIRSAEINSSQTELFLTDEGLKESSAKMVEIGDILYALYGATSGEVGISQIKGAINQAILAIQPNESYNSRFIMQWLRLQKQSIIDKYLQGGQGNLSGSIVKNLEIYFPSYDEQQKIGIFFKQLDDTITLHQRKLDYLKEMKKGLLQKMFV